MRALVVGLGRMGAFHARALRDLGLDVSTVDPNPTRLADYRRVPALDFDVVCIATPITALADEACRWIGRARKMLIEKPMAATVADALELQRRTAGHDVAVGFVERFNPVVVALRADPAWRRDAPVKFTRWNTRPSVDVALDLTTHDADLVGHLEITGPPMFASRDDAPVIRRTIHVWRPAGPRSVNLTAHRESPLHAQWAAFLAGHPGPATPADAVAALYRAIGYRQEALAS